MNRRELKQYKSIYFEIRELREEINELERFLWGRGDSIYTQRGKEDMTEQAESLTRDLKDLLLEKVADLTVMRRKIEKSFLCLTSAERRLMRKKYIFGKTNQVIANELFMSIDNVKRIHTNILKKIEANSS